MIKQPVKKTIKEKGTDRDYYTFFTQHAIQSQHRKRGLPPII